MVGFDAVRFDAAQLEQVRADGERARSTRWRAGWWGAMLLFSAWALTGCGWIESEPEPTDSALESEVEEFSPPEVEPPRYAWRLQQPCSRSKLPPVFSSEKPVVLDEAFCRVYVIGASFSAGFGHDLPFAEALRETLVMPAHVESVADARFFASPRSNALDHLDAVHGEAASMVVALDYLFWFAYGERSFESRVRGLLRALALLDTVSVPIWIGDLPDMRGASSMMLPKRWIPPREQLDVLNGMIRLWASERARVRVLPLAAWHERLHAGEAFELRGEEFYFDPLRVFTWDQLHPSPEGTRLIALLLCQEFEAAFPAFTEDQYLPASF